MKKLVFFLSALFTTCFAQAQDGIKLGLKAGVNLSSVMGDDIDAKNKFGFHAGGFLDYGLSEVVSIRPEVLYSMKGYEAEMMGMEQKITLHYLDVPILARYNADGFFFEGGPTLGFLLSGKGEADGKSEDIEDAKTFEFGYAAGLGYVLPSGLGIGLRYQGGFTNIFEEADDEDEGDFKLTNSVIQLSLSYTLGR